MSDRVMGRTIKVAILATKAGQLRYGVSIQQHDHEVVLYAKSSEDAKVAASLIWSIMHEATDYTVGLHMAPPLVWVLDDEPESDSDLPTIDDVRGILKP